MTQRASSSYVDIVCPSISVDIRESQSPQVCMRNTGSDFTSWNKFPTISPIRIWAVVPIDRYCTSIRVDNEVVGFLSFNVRNGFYFSPLSSNLTYFVPVHVLRRVVRHI